MIPRQSSTVAANAIPDTVVTRQVRRAEERAQFKRLRSMAKAQAMKDKKPGGSAAVGRPQRK